MKKIKGSLSERYHTLKEKLSKLKSIVKARFEVVIELEESKAVFEFIGFATMWGFIVNYIFWSLLGFEFSIKTLFGYGFVWWLLCVELSLLYKQFK